MAESGFYIISTVRDIYMYDICVVYINITVLELWLYVSSRGLARRLLSDIPSVDMLVNFAEVASDTNRSSRALASSPKRRPDPLGFLI